MVENRFKQEENEKSVSRGIFGLLFTKFRLEQSWNSELPVKYLLKVIFTVALGICYVGSNHRSERIAREIEQLEKEVEDLRADVTTLEADYMFNSKLSEVAEEVKALGLKESRQPPAKIIVKEDEY